MRLRLFVYACIIALFCTNALAQEAASEETVTIVGERASSTYNPSVLQQIFSSIEENNGMLYLKITVRGAEKDFGVIYGNITANAETKRVIIKNGGYMSLGNAEIGIIAESFMIDIGNPERVVFNIGKGQYNEHYYSYLCGAENCRMQAVMDNRRDMAFYMNFTGEGAVISSAITDKYKEGRLTETEKAEVINISNLFEISTDKKTSRLTIMARVAERSRFGDMEVSSAEKMLLRRFYSSAIEPEGYMDIAIANNADIFVSEGKNFGMRYKDSRGNGGLHLFIDGNELLKLEKGGILIYSDENTFEKCSRESQNELGGGVCAFVSSAAGKLRFKPFRGSINTEIMAENGEVLRTTSRMGPPFKLTVKYPAAQRYNYLGIMEFESADVESRIQVEKEGVSGAMVFSRDDVQMKDGANWYDFGTSFKSLIYDAGKKFYSLFECVLDEKQCYLDGTLVSGEFKRMRGRLERCSSDDDCGEGRACRQKLCIRQAGCQQLTNVNSGRDSANAVDIVFVSDRYMNERDFVADVGYAVNGDGTHIGILTVEPFSIQKQKFNIWSVYTEKTMLPIEAGPFGDITPAESYVNAMGMNCPFGDRIIILSGLKFRDFAQFGGNAYVSRTGDGEWFGAYAVHEFGHSFGELKDEYNQSKGKQAGGCYAGPPNCVVETAAAETYGWTDENAAEAISNNWRGCGGDCGKFYVNNLRPSFNSIMRYPEEAGGDVFNTPSKAWIQRILDRY